MADQNKKNQQEPDIHQLLKVRREKLAELQNAGKDPFQITKYSFMKSMRQRFWQAEPR